MYINIDGRIDVFDGRIDVLDVRIDVYTDRWRIDNIIYLGEISIAYAIFKYEFLFFEWIYLQ